MSALLEPTNGRVSSARGASAHGRPSNIAQMSAAQSAAVSDSGVRTGRLDKARLLHGIGPRFHFGGVELLDCTIEEAADAIVNAGMAKQRVGIHMCNAFTLTIAMREERYRDALSYHSLNLPDGTPLVWFARAVSGTPSRGPVRGPSLMKAVLARPGVKHFLLGGSEQVLADLEREIKDSYPDAQVVGAVAPPFRDHTALDIEDYSRCIRESGAHVVWVGLGTPRQDNLIADLVDQVDSVLVGVGAAFDFLSGNKPEAPAFLHGTGLEWLHRLFSEPQRLWRRYLVCNAMFLAFAGREIVRQRRQSR